MKKILICLLLSILLLPSSSYLYANENTSPFSLSIVIPPSYDGSRQVSVENKFSEFHVLLKNISGKPQRIWREWCSWGRHNLSFELTIEGEKMLITKTVISYLKNYPDDEVIDPNEFVVFDVFIASGGWLNLPKIKEGQNRLMGELKAIYEIAPEAEAKELGVWTGKIESAPVKVTVIK
jgi:hypothetical protein